MRSSILALVVTLVAAPAGAQKLSKQKIEQAKTHYKAGVAAELAARYDEAVKEFTAAYDITKDPKVFYQIARAQERAGHTGEAIGFYKRYLAEAKPSPGAQAETQAKIDELEKKQAATPPPADGTGGELIAPGEGEGAGAASQPAAVAEEAPEAEGGGRGYRTAAWIAVGLTAAALTTAGVLATSASAREEDLDRLVEHRDTTTGLPYAYQGATVNQYEEALDEGDKLERYSIIAFVGAGAFAAAAATFFILDALQPAEPTDTARIAPSVGRDGAGVTATLTF